MLAHVLQWHLYMSSPLPSSVDMYLFYKISLVLLGYGTRVGLIPIVSLSRIQIVAFQ